MITRDDLRDWLVSHGCIATPLKETNNTARSIKFVNPKNGTHAYLDTPIDGTPIKEYLVCHVCVQLGVPIPIDVQHQEPLVDHIKKRFTGKKH